MRAIVVILLGAALVGDANAQRLAVKPPTPFVATKAQEGTPTIFRIKSSTNKPVSVRPDGDLCLLTFTESPDVAGLSQAQLNARKDTRDWQQYIVGRMRNSDYRVGEAFTVTGIRGMDFLGLKKTAPGEKTTATYLAIIETPKGQTILTCATLEEGFESAVTQFRAIRDSIVPER